MSTIITPSEEQINIVVNDEKISINVESGDVIVNVNEQIVEVSTVNGAYPLPTTVYSVFGRTGNIIAVDGDYDLGELGDVTLVSSTNGDVLTYDGTKWINKAVTGTGTVTSVDMSVPVGLQVSGNPITINGTLALNYASGYSLPTTAKQTTWDTAYNDSIVSASVSGTTTKTLTLNQQDGGTITASWTDIDTNLVTSVNGYVGTVVLTTTDIAEGTRLYYTEARVSNNVDVAANTAARHAALTIGTANGLSLASQVLSLALASASTTGALSSTDWNKFNDASGTVTSVAATVPAGLTISGSPIVSAGTLAFGLDTGYTIPLSTQLVPSGGSTGQLLAKNSATNYDTLWIDNYTEQLRDTVKAAVAINKGQAVYVSGANGTNQLVSLASNATEGTSSKTLGLASQNFVINDIGQIITEGLLAGLDTSTATAGDPVWLGVSGNLIYGLANKPVAPAHLVYIGVVTRVNINNGEIYVKIQNGFELREIHDVLISSVANNEGLFYESATSLWKNKSIATVLGYTPISLTSLSGVSPLSYNNTTGAFSIAQATTSVNGYLSSTDWNTFNGKQAALNGTGFVKATGTTISYDNSTYYLASNPSAYIALTGLSATAPLSYNNTTGGFTISQAGVSGDGYLSSTDWNTFNNKQASGNYITALSGEATASGPGSAAVTLSTSAVTGKLLTGVNITGGSISATDSILIAFGKVQNQINGVLGGAIYQSVWNASTNSPTLTSGTGTKGYYYIVSVAGSTNLDGITDWKVGDWAIFNGTTWNKVDNSDAVSSVNGYTGAVSLTTSDITEGSRLYYTEGRVSANTDVAANTAARHSAVTIGTANGLSLSTQALSLGLASTSATGALSSTDWNTFNLKQAALSGTGFVKISGSTIIYDNSTYYLASNPTAYISLLALSSSATGLTYTNTTGVFSFTAGYSIPTNASQTQWDTAYSNRISTLNGLTAATQNFSTGMSGTDFNISSTTATHTFNIPSASATARGLLSNTDWTTFNNKQSAITLTTTGTSGAATFSSNTLNIPNYAPDLSGYVTLATTQTISGAKTFNNSDLNTLFVSNPDTTGATTGSGIGFKAYNGTSVTQYGGIFLTSNTWSFGTYSAQQLSIGSDGTGGLALRSANSAPISFFTGGASAGVSTQRMILNSSGNLGLGVTPSAWSGAIAMQIGSYASIYTNNSSGSAEFSSNAYKSAASAWTYLNTNNATNYRQLDGSHAWFNAPSGTAGNAISFTQAMTLTSDGNLLLGTPTNTGFRLAINGPDGTSYVKFTSPSATTGGRIGYNGNELRIDQQENADLVLRTNGATRLTIASTGAATFSSSVTAVAGTFSGSLRSTIGDLRSLGAASNSVASGAFVTLTDSGTTYQVLQQLNASYGLDFWFYNGSWNKTITFTNAGAATFSSTCTATGFFESSDSRLKTLIQDNYQTKGIASITPKLYTKNGKVELGYYAQDFVGILDSAVSKGSDDMLSLSYREVLVAKVYALEQRIKELENK
jgi:hypothetical protein